MLTAVVIKIARGYTVLSSRKPDSASLYESWTVISLTLDHFLCATRLVTNVYAASDPTRIGSEQGRDVRFEGDWMVLRPPPRAAD
jgi:hypothetical protein